MAIKKIHKQRVDIDDTCFNIIANAANAKGVSIKKYLQSLVISDCLMYAMVSAKGGLKTGTAKTKKRY